VNQTSACGLPRVKTTLRFGKVGLADTGQSPAFTQLIEAQERAFAVNLGQSLTTPGTRTWAKGVLDAWTKEIFCDLFALRHLGAAFAFALIDILSLIGLMGEETEAIFDSDHPAPAARFREQLHRLEKDGWWTAIGNMPSEHVALLTRLAGKTDYAFEFREHKFPGFVRAFQTLIPFIHALVTEITPHCQTEAEDFRLRREDVENCLLHGVVPSKLLADGDTASPTPVSMINAAYCFYLTRLPELMAKLEGQREDNLQHRKTWIERLEAWTMKGIEDYQLLVASGRGVPTKRSVATVATNGDLTKKTNTFAVFAREEINERLRLDVDDPMGLVITPLLDKEEAIDADSVDLRLGTYFLLPRSLPEPYFSPDKNTATVLHLKVHVPLGRYLVVPAHQTVLGSTLEFIKLPCDASGEILTKSSIARTFIVVETAPWVHPEYRGCLTLEIANVSNTPVLLYPGRPIGQLILLRVGRDHDPTSKIKSTYFGPVQPEAPAFDDPEAELLNIGVPRISVIRKGTVDREGQFEPRPSNRERGLSGRARGNPGTNEQS
jgi:dCTP deaminase